jgi:hypothetical protein
MADPLERVYRAMLVVAPLAFLVVALVYGLQGDLLQAVGFFGVAAIVGALSLYFYRGGG